MVVLYILGPIFSFHAIDDVIKLKIDPMKLTFDKSLEPDDGEIVFFVRFLNVDLIKHIKSICTSVFLVNYIWGNA